MNIFFSYIQILRPLNLLFAATSVVISAWLTNTTHKTEIILHAIMVVISFAGASNILNDILDIKIDKKNQPNRPLPSGRINRAAATLYMLGLYFCGICFLQTLSLRAIGIALLIVLPLLIIYTSELKRIALVGNVAIAVSIASVFLFSELALTGQLNQMIIPGALAFGLTLIRELIKDIQDVEGDELQGLKTFPVLFGIKNSISLVVILTVLLCSLAWLPYCFNLYGKLYGTALLFFVEIPLILSIFFLLKNPTSYGSALISRATKWITLGGMITILCSSQ